MTLADILARTPLFSGLDADSCAKIATQARLKTCARGTDLFAAGDPAQAYFLVLSGWIKLYRLSRDGGEAVIHICPPGESFAEAAIFSPTGIYPVSAQAIEDSTVLEIPRQQLADMIRADGNLALSMLGSISARQKLLVQQIEQMTARSAAQRLGAFLLRLCAGTAGNSATVNLPYDKSLVARRLNIQPETFSRALARLKPCGVAVRKSVITIADRAALAHYCEYDERDRPC